MYKFYHGTSWERAEQINRTGFRASADGCLGPGVYVARRDKAERFAKDTARHGKCIGGMVEVLVTVRAPKFVDYNDVNWLSEGYDACRAENTSASTNMEWCIGSASQVQVIRTIPVRCARTAIWPTDEARRHEEAELEKHAAALKAEISKRQHKLDALGVWQDEHKRDRERELAEAAQKERKRKERDDEQEQQEREEAEERDRQRAERAREQQEERERQKSRGTRITYSLTPGAQETVASLVVINDGGAIFHCFSLFSHHFVTFSHRCCHFVHHFFHHFVTFSIFSLRRWFQPHSWYAGEGLQKGIRRQASAEPKLCIARDERTFLHQEEDWLDSVERHRRGVWRVRQGE